MLKFDFRDRVVIVTGAAHGIGKVIAARFKEAGATVYLVDIAEDAVAEAGRELQCGYFAADLSKREQASELVASVVEKEGRLDILALAAGGNCGYLGLEIEKITPENWQMILSANLDSVIWLAQAGSAVMKTQGWGRIITITSGAGLRPGLAGLHAYTAAKHAVVGLTKQLSLSLGRFGITVNSVAPGLVLSSKAAIVQWEGYGEDGQRRFKESLHTGRVGEADDIAMPTLFFASEEAGWITGQVLSADGGRS